MGCGNCSDPLTIPYSAHESTVARFERTVKRLIIALVAAVVLIFASNALWLLAWSQYDYSGEETVVTQDGEGLNIIGDRNITDYGTDDNG